VQDVATPATEIAIDEARQMYRQLYGDEVANSIELGDEMEFPKPTEVLGRIAAQTAKQVIFQKVREAEREHVFAEYNDRIGEVVNGTVKRFENGDIILEIGRIEAVLPRKEQSRAESYTPADRVRTVIKGVNRSAKGPQIVLSRTDPALLIKLFEQEVPEIYDGTVMIRGAVREAGDRAKVAVFSRERDVDPVGACVGMKGTRVQSIIRELRGEKIDIVEWSEDPIAFVTNALSPAKVQRVSIVDDRDRVMEVVVEDKQLSLAIGKKGQNVRLAAKLTGWRIDIKSEEEKRREIEDQMTRLTAPATPLTSLAGVGAKTIEKMEAAGINNVEALAAMTPEQLMEIPGIGEKMVEKIQLSVADYFQSLENPPAEPESLEALAEEETAVDSTEQAEATEETAEAADVAAEEIEAPTEAEQIVEDAASEKSSEASEGNSNK